MIVKITADEMKLFSADTTLFTSSTDNKEYFVGFKKSFEWFSSNKLTLNYEKCKLMCFGKKTVPLNLILTTV